MTGTGRAQTGLERLGAFLLAIFLVLLVTPTVLGFAGVDVRAPGEADSEEPPRLTVLGIEGFAIDEDRSSIGAVRVVVTNTGGGEIDPRALSVTWVDNGTHDLVAARSDASADGTFVVRAGTESREETVLRERTDRAVLEFDIGSDDLDGADEVGDRLDGGESATLTVVTADGESTRLVLSPSQTLPGEGSVAL